MVGFLIVGATFSFPAWHDSLALREIEVVKVVEIAEMFRHPLSAAHSLSFAAALDRFGHLARL
jgi:hypothetical protein